MFFANIQDNKLNGVSKCKMIADNLIQIEVSEDVFNNIEHYNYKDGKIIINPDYEIELKKETRKAEILDELDKIDLKTIRALRSNDTEYIEKYENEAIELRKELASL